AEVTEPEKRQSRESCHHDATHRCSWDESRPARRRPPPALAAGSHSSRWRHGTVATCKKSRQPLEIVAVVRDNQGFPQLASPRRYDHESHGNLRFERAGLGGCGGECASPPLL